MVHDVHLVGARRRPGGAASRRPLPDAAHRVGLHRSPVETGDPGDRRCLARSPPLLDGLAEERVERQPVHSPAAADHQRPIARVTRFAVSARGRGRKLRDPCYRLALSQGQSALWRTLRRGSAVLFWTFSTMPSDPAG